MCCEQTVTRVENWARMLLRHRGGRSQSVLWCVMQRYRGVLSGGASIAGPRRANRMQDALVVDKAICTLPEFERRIIKAEYSSSSEYGCYDDMMRARSRKARAAGVFTRNYDMLLNDALDSLTDALALADRQQP